MTVPPSDHYIEQGLLCIHNSISGIAHLQGRQDTQSSLYLEMLDPFEQRRAQVLQGLGNQERDKSVAGGVDARIQSLVDCMNQHPDLYTTSSCSGTPSNTSGPLTLSCLPVSSLPVSREFQQKQASSSMDMLQMSSISSCNPLCHEVAQQGTFVVCPSSMLSCSLSMTFLFEQCRC